MSNRKKIAIITPFLARGGLEKVAIVGAEELNKHYDVTLIVMDPFHIDYPYDGHMIKMNVSLRNRGVMKRIYNIGVSIYTLWRLKKKYAFDLVISHGELANIPNVFSGGKNNILVVHGNRFSEITKDDIKARLVNYLIKYIYFAKNISKIVTVSEGIRQSFIKVLQVNQNDIVSIYNPFNVDEIQILMHESLEKYKYLFSHDVLCITGRLNMLKGQWYLLRIFKELKKENKNLKLVLLGDGEMKEKLISLSQDLELKTYSIWSENSFDDQYDVYFLGFQKNPFKFVHASKLFIMTSISEGFGNVIVEAMACATPVISTNCNFGPGEIICQDWEYHTMVTKPIYGEYGVLMPTFDKEYIASNVKLGERELLWVNTLNTLLQNDMKLTELTQNGISRANNFHMTNIIAIWKTLIDEILTN